MEYLVQRTVNATPGSRDSGEDTEASYPYDNGKGGALPCAADTSFPTKRSGEMSWR